MTLRIDSSLPPERLGQLALSQISAMFPDGEAFHAGDLAPAVVGALRRLEHCFSYITNKYFFDGQRVIFDHLNGDQYAMWLYFLGNELFRQGGPVSICKKLFLLNKLLHGCDIFYEVSMPSIFLLVHPIGTVIGRGEYSDFFIAYQRVGVGSNHNCYPSIGRHVTLHPGSAVLGKSLVGDYCSIAAESLVLDGDVPSHSIYIGNPRDYLIKPRTNNHEIWRT